MTAKGDFKAFYQDEWRPAGWVTWPPYCFDDQEISKSAYMAQLSLLGMRHGIPVDTSTPIHAGDGTQITSAFRRAVELVADACENLPLDGKARSMEADALGWTQEDLYELGAPVPIERKRLKLAEIANACNLSVNSLKGYTGAKSGTAVTVETFSWLVKGLVSVLWPNGSTILDERYRASGGTGALINQLKFVGWPGSIGGEQREIAALMLLGEDPIGKKLASRGSQRTKNLELKRDLYRFAALTCTLLNEQDLKVVLNIAQTLRRRSIEEGRLIKEGAWGPSREALGPFGQPRESWARSDGEHVDGSIYNWHLAMTEGELARQHYAYGMKDEDPLISELLNSGGDDDGAPIFGRFVDDGEFKEEHLVKEDPGLLLLFDRDNMKVLCTSFGSEVAWLATNAPEWSRDVLASFASDFKPLTDDGIGLT